MQILFVTLLLFSFACTKTKKISNDETYYYVFAVDVLKSGNMQGKQLRVALVRPDPSYRGVYLPNLIPIGNTNY